MNWPFVLLTMYQVPSEGRQTPMSALPSGGARCPRVLNANLNADDATRCHSTPRLAVGLVAPMGVLGVELVEDIAGLV
ncbi:MAG: hypothetical protein IPM59_06980 [Chloracidobacterium sp.]|nr:hypothetical protein [Chloracidobacterium sp.]